MSQLGQRFQASKIGSMFTKENLFERFTIWNIVLGIATALGAFGGMPGSSLCLEMDVRVASVPMVDGFRSDLQRWRWRRCVLFSRYHPGSVPHLLAIQIDE